MSGTSDDLSHAAGGPSLCAPSCGAAKAFDSDGIYADLADGVAEQTLAEAAKFAEEQLLPLDQIGDRIGATSPTAP